MARLISFDCPRPPSTNRLWRSVTNKAGRTRVYRNPDYVAWVKVAWAEWLTQKPKDFKGISGKFKATILIHPGKRRCDLGNYEKAMMDAAQAFGIISNDRNALEIQIKFVPHDEAPKGTKLIIEELDIYPDMG